jgi:hypothetical protein
LNTVDDSNDENLKNFKAAAIDVKKSFHSYWDNYYSWHYEYNGQFKIFNWFRFNKWLWTKKNYDDLRNKSDKDYEKLKFNWFKFHKSYLNLSKNSSYHSMATKLYFEYYDKLQIIKKSIDNHFTNKWK